MKEMRNNNNQNEAQLPTLQKQFLSCEHTQRDVRVRSAMLQRPYYMKAFRA